MPARTLRCREQDSRAKQERWQLCEDRHLRYVSLAGKRKTPAWQAERTLRNLHELSSLVTPRVWSTVFSTIWNRWTTARRFQQRESSNNVCVLGRSPTAEDSIEHYSRCLLAQGLAKHLRLDPTTQVNLHTFNLCNPHISTREELTTSAILIYSMYRATNTFRRNREARQNVVSDALCQWTREAVFEHTVSSSILDNVWNARHVTSPICGGAGRTSIFLTRKRAAQHHDNDMDCTLKRARTIPARRH